MKTIYLLFTETGSVLSQLIKWYTQKTYNHASIAFDSELNEVYSFGRKIPWNPLYGGFNQEKLSEGLFRQANCVVYSLSVTEAEYERMHDYVKMFLAQSEEYRYNFIGLLGVAMQIPIEREKAYFCSQFVASVLSECDRFHFQKEPALTTPFDIMTALPVQLIYEGTLAAYLNESPLPILAVEIE